MTVVVLEIHLRKQIETQQTSEVADNQKQSYAGKQAGDTQVALARVVNSAEIS